MTDAAVDTSSAPLGLPAWLLKALGIGVTVAIPLLLILINARLLMTDTYLTLAYNMPFVPEDPFGFTQEDRLELAPLALGYLFNDEGIDFLGDQTFPNGEPLYNERELKHMVDVKVVTQQLIRFGFVLLGVTVAAAAVIAAADREQFFRTMINGSLLTGGVIIAGLIAVATSFNWLFTQFHNLFFEEGTWLFLYSDTLIRLFPIEFWAFAFALMFGGALLEALLIGGGSWLALRNMR